MFGSKRTGNIATGNEARAVISPQLGRTRSAAGFATRS